MNPRIFTLKGNGLDASAIAEAAQILKGGGLVVFPTETVYGLAADPTNPAAIKRLNSVKGRPPEKPYSLHLHTADQVRQFVVNIPPLALRLMERFWPGPLTIIMRSKDGETVGFRLPDNPVAQVFLRVCGVAVAGSSANRSGQPAPTNAQDVLAALGSEFDCLIDAGPTKVGRESTVVEVVDNQVEIRREGTISKEAILKVACLGRGVRPKS